MRARLSALLHHPGTRGACAAASWAAALCGFATFMLRVAGAGADHRGSMLQAFEGLEALGVWVPLAGAAGLQAAWVGSRTRKARPTVRVLGIGLTLLVGGGLVVLLILWAWAVGHALVSEGPLKALSAIVGLPVAVMFVFFVGLPPFLPLLSIPVVGAAILIEGSTRIDPELPHGGPVDEALFSRLAIALLVGAALAEGVAFLVRR